MSKVGVYQDLFDHNDWANTKIWGLCAELSDEQLDRPREMGFGSLRNTLFHILEAEKIWLERWLGQPWRPLEVDAGELSVAAIAAEAKPVADQRNELIANEQGADFTRVVEFQDSKRNPGRLPIGGLLNHVSNHGIHHRAQVLSFLRTYGITVPAGLDYLFWKLARPSCELPEESLEPLRAYGLETATAPGNEPKFEAQKIGDYFAYGDWAMQRVLQAAESLDAAALDQDLEMGMGTLRKNLQHVVDAERWWVANWKTDLAPFPRGEEARPLTALQELHAEVAEQRNRFIDTLDEDSAGRVVRVAAGGPMTCFRVTESLLQLCSHGTHHRAQCLNMLRTLGCPPPGIDLLDWMRQRSH